MIRFILIFYTWGCLHSADHLLLTKVVTQPNEAESFSIYNPTDEAIQLDSFYVCDDEDYYQIQTDTFTSHGGSGFTAKFPSISIDSHDTLTIILNQNYTEYYGAGFTADLYMFETEGSSMIETGDGSFGGGPGSNKMNDVAEMLILFYWDGTESSLKQDVDYFLWGNEQNAIYKTVEQEGYQYDDTHPGDQKYFMRAASADSAYSRIGTVETGETDTGGNGIYGDDETSENFRESWEIIALFNLGCTDEAASNYDPEAEDDDGSCEYLITIDEIIHNCGNEINGNLACDGEYALSAQSAGECPLYGTSVTTSGIIVDYFDLRPFGGGGPFSFTIQDSDDNQIGFVIWPENSAYQDGFDITLNDSLNVLTQSPYGTYEVIITGELGVYCDDDEQLDIESDWQVTVEDESDITIIEHEIVISEQLVFEVAPYPFIPSEGQKITYTYSVPNGYRCIIRIFDISGRFITTLYEGVPIFFDSPIKSDTWNGRNQLNQLSPPGVYLIHLEATEVSTGKSYENIAPIVIGIPLK